LSEPEVVITLAVIVTDATGQPSDRLDSWKAIAEYLGRDVRTLRRWEQRGFPVRRVPGGSGHSVFAFKTEIDAWLRDGGESGEPAPPVPLTTPAPPGPPAPQRAPVARRPFRWRSVVAALIVIAAIASWKILAPSAAEEPLTLAMSQTQIVASDSSGREHWRYSFPEGTRNIPFPEAESYAVLGGDRPAILVATSQSMRNDKVLANGALRMFSTEGRLVRTFEFDDRLRFRDGDYEAPWMLTDFKVDQSTDGRRIAVATHHHLWWPSIVTILDEQWKRQSSFVNSGWVDSLRWVSADRLAISGFHQAKNGGMLALLDGRNISGASPEAPDSKYACKGCPPGSPLAYAVFPRSELNRVTGSAFNRASIESTPGRLVVHTLETDIPPDRSYAVDAIYEFSLSMELQRATYGGRYWDRHKALELEGKIKHSRENCPERDGPPVIEMWDPVKGWRTIRSAR
jgi:hypothetical protein